MAKATLGTAPTSEVLCCGRGLLLLFIFNTKENQGSLLLVVVKVPMMLIEGPRGVQFQRSVQTSMGAITRYSSYQSSLGSSSRMWDSPFLSELLCC